MPSMYCPMCTSVDFEGERIRWFELPLLLVLIRPFRCRACRRRFYRPLWWYSTFR